MLHILWMILKMILIALGILVGLVLLLLILVLFVPIRYRAAGSRHEENIQGEARVSWLLSAVSATVSYRESRPSMCIRIFGISLETLRKLPAKLRRGKRRAAKSGETERAREDGKAAAEKPEAESPGISHEPDADGTGTLPEPVRDGSLRADDAEETAGEGKIAALWRRGCELVRAAWTGIVRVFRMIAGIPGRIRRFFHRISLTITQFYGKIDRWKSFFQDERTAAGLRLVWGECKKLLRHAAPRKISGNLIIGLDNPAATGQVLALFGAALPLHENRVAVQPVFDRKMLEADVQMRGRVYLFYVLVRGMKLYFDKNIKYIMKEFNKEG